MLRRAKWGWRASVSWSRGSSLAVYDDAAAATAALATARGEDEADVGSGWRRAAS